MSRTKPRPFRSPVPILAGVALTIGIIGGCAAPQPVQAEEPPKEFLAEHYQRLSDGRVVFCLVRHNEIVAGYASTRSTISTFDCELAGAKVQP